MGRILVLAIQDNHNDIGYTTTNLSLESSGFNFRNPPVLDHPLHDPQDVPAIVDPGMMPPHQIHVQRSEHLRHPLRVFVPVFLLEGRLDVDDPLLEVGGE